MLALPASASAVTIDDFSTGTGSVTADALAPPTRTSTGFSTAPSALGGFRAVLVTKTDGANGLAVNASWNQPTTGPVLSFTSVAASTGEFRLIYDGDPDQVIDANGLSASFSGPSFDIDATVTGAQIPVTISLFSDNDRCSQTTQVLHPARRFYSIPFDLFFPVSSCTDSVNLADIGAVVFETEPVTNAGMTLSSMRVADDVDRDGVLAPADCDDTNPAVKPGATDAPGNGVDEDCSGADTPAAVSPTAVPLAAKKCPKGKKPAKREGKKKCVKRKRR